MDELLLSDFIRSTIVEIAKGVEEVKKDLEGLDVQINPHLNLNGFSSTNTSRNRQCQEIEFDLMLTAELKESKESDKGRAIGMKVVSVFNLGFNNKGRSVETSQNTLVNRVKFSIPISLSPNTKPKFVARIYSDSYSSSDLK